MKKIYAKVLMVSVLMLWSSLSWATDRYVSTTGNDGNSGTSGSPWLTIQHAIDNSVSSDVIHVAAGTYTEDLSIPTGKTNLNIVGAGTTSIIQGVDHVASGLFPLADPNIEILGSGTKIHSFTIQNPAWTNGFYSSGMVIGTTNVEIYDNTFEVAGSDDTDDISQGLQTYATLDISGLNIHDNTFTHIANSVAGYEGIYINKNMGTGTITIDGNTFSGDILRAITTEASRTTINDNSIITELAAGLPGGYQGINIAYALGSGTVSNVSVSGNTVKGLTEAGGFQYGLVVGNGANTNTFTGIIVTQNYIQGNQVGVRIREDAGEVAIYNNSLTSNSSFCIQDDDPGVTNIAASCNWWGTTVSATIATLVSGNVNYIPYLSNGTDANPGTSGFQPSVFCCDLPPSYSYEVTPTTSWETSTSQTIISGECIIFKFNSTSGKTYTFKTGCATGGGDLATANFDTWIDVWDASGHLITENDDGCAEYRSKIEWTATYSGTVYVKVRGYGSGNYGAFSLSYKYADGTGSGICKDPSLGESDATITPTTAWQTDVSHSLLSDGCYVYQFTATAGKTYTFKTGCATADPLDLATADFDTWIDLTDASGHLVMENDDGCTEYRSKIEWTATYGGNAYIKVRGYGSTNFGAFRLSYIYADGSGSGTCKDPSLGQSDATITPTTAWQTDVSQSLLSNACYVYQFTATAGKTYTFKTGCATGAPDEATADFDTWIDLLDASGHLIMENDDGCTEYRSKIDWTATYGGTAYIKVRGYGSNNFGAFRLSYIYADGSGSGICKDPSLGQSDATITPTTAWQTDVSQSLLSNACYVYQFTATAGKTYTFKTGCATGAPDEATADFDTWIDLTDASGYLMMENDDGCAQYRSKIEWTSTYGGTAYIKVRGFGPNNYGAFRLSYKYVDGGSGSGSCKDPSIGQSDATITPTTTWQTDASHSLLSNGCYVYQFAPTTGKTYTFKTGCATGTPDEATADFDSWIDLLDESGHLIMENDDGCTDYRSKIEWSSNYAGTAYIKVRGFGPNNYGAFSLAYKYVIGKSIASVGDNESLSKLIEVFPNPADQIFNVVSQSPLKFSTITMTDFTGRLIRTWEMDGLTTKYYIQSSDFVPGVYILGIQTQDGWVRKKINISR